MKQHCYQCGELIYIPNDQEKDFQFYICKNCWEGWLDYARNLQPEDCEDGEDISKPPLF